MRENVVRKNSYADIIKVLHVGGKINPSEMFTKEKREKAYDLNARSTIIVSESDFDSQITARQQNI